MIVLNLIRDNVRFADAAMGDLRAQIAACRLGERRLTELLQRYGLATVRACIERIYAESEAPPAARSPRSPTASTRPSRSWTTTACGSTDRCPSAYRSW